MGMGLDVIGLRHVLHGAAFWGHSTLLPTGSTAFPVPPFGAALGTPCLPAAFSASRSCCGAGSGRGPLGAPMGAPQDRAGHGKQPGGLRPAVLVLGAALLHPLICIAEPLFALINVSAKCLMCEISFLLAGIDGAVWDSRLLRFPGQDSANQPGVVSLGFCCAQYQLAGIPPPP